MQASWQHRSIGEKIFGIFPAFLNGVRFVYLKTLSFCLSIPGVIFQVAALVGTIMFVGFLAKNFLTVEIMPKQDQGMISVKLEMPVGTNIETTDSVARIIESRIKGVPEIVHYSMNVGGSNGFTTVNQATMRVKLLKDWEGRTRSTDQIVDSLRPYLAGYSFPDTSMANVKKRRKELLMLEATEEMLDKNVSIEQGGYKPTIALVGGLKYSNNQNEFYKWDAPDWDDNINKYIALNLTMNLFNGMKTKEAVVQAKSNLRSTQIQKETAERGFRVQIESCVNTLSDADAQIEIAKRQIDLAQKNYDLTNAAYKIGRETQLNLLTAENSLRTAKLDYMSAIVEWNKAYNALLQATGEY